MCSKEDRILRGAACQLLRYGVTDSQKVKQMRPFVQTLLGCETYLTLNAPLAKCLG